jgi:hypothetical protein
MIFQNLSQGARPALFACLVIALVPASVFAQSAPAPSRPQEALRQFRVSVEKLASPPEAKGAAPSKPRFLLVVEGTSGIG